MKAALCDFCLRSGMLCSKCQEKIKSGEVSQVDLKIAQLLLNLEKNYQSLQNVCFHKAVEAGDVLAVVVGKGDIAPLLSYGGKILKALAKKTGKRIRVLEHGVTRRKFLEDLFAPLTILTINTIWLPDGTTETKVILRKRGRRIPINVKASKKLAKKIRGITLRVEFSD
jgi:transcription antitermination factor NusA-like protein